MFHENGTWKEFGYQRSARYTLFPVWLFAIVWAIVSYTLAAAIVWAWRAGPTESLAAASIATERAVHFARNAPEILGEEDEETRTDLEDDYEETPISRVAANQVPITETIRVRPDAKRIQTPVRQPRKGYYVIDPASEKSGLRRYVYYGEAPPPELQGSTIAPSREGGGVQGFSV
jgi:hypothetical protein